MLGIIMLIAIIFDISERIDDFLNGNAPLGAIIKDYYFNFVVYYANLFNSLLIFISVIFFTSKMASDTEIIAILNSGMSFNRLLLPYFIAASILAFASLYLNHYVIPGANKKRLQFENTYIRNPYLFKDRNVHRQIKPGEFIYIESYNTENNTGYQFSMENWEGFTLKSKLNASMLRWDTTKNNWKIENYFIRKLNGEKERIIEGINMDTVLGFTPKEFTRRLNNIEMMTTPQLNNFIKRKTLEGSDELPWYYIEKHQRSSYPFSTYILVLIGVTIAGKKIRGGIGLHIVYGLLICVTYILIMKVSTVYATNAGLDPLAAVWLPNILFAGLAVYLLRFAPR